MDALYNAILSGDARLAHDLTKEALSNGGDAMALIQKSMVPAMDEVGRRFECHEFFLPELMLAGRAMKAALELTRPQLAKTGHKGAGRVVVGTVQGDLHDIGKNLVVSMLEGAGYEVFDLGVNVAPSAFIAAVNEKQANIVAMSALLTTTMPAMKTTIDAFREAGLRDRVRIFIGGAPISQRFANEIGADGYSATAVGAVGLARAVMA